MKLSASRTSHGFTLVELLVVISIIAVLAAAGFSAGNAAIQKAKKITALATCTAIETSVNNFFTEYGYMPKDISVDPTTPLNTKDDIEFLNVLLGLTETTTPPLNTRAIKFLTVKEGKANKNGLMYSSDGKTITGLYDPWGGKYYVMLDGDYNDAIEVKTAAGSSKKLNGRKVAVWSNGADAAKDAVGKVTDDVMTW